MHNFVKPVSLISDGVPEQYGQSTSSGNIADAIRHAKPFFAPAWLQVESPLEKSCIRYESVADIITIMEQLSGAAYTAIQANAYEASLHFTKERIIARNEELFT